MLSIYSPEYLISTIFSPVDNTRHTYIQRKNNKQPLLCCSLVTADYPFSYSTHWEYPPSAHKFVIAIFEHMQVGQEGVYELSIQVSKLKFILFWK